MTDAGYAALERLLLAGQVGRRGAVREEIRAAREGGAPDSLIERILEATRPPTLPLASGQALDHRIARAFSLFHLRIRDGRVTPLSARAIDALGTSYEGSLADAVNGLLKADIPGGVFDQLQADVLEAGYAHVDSDGHRVFALSDDGDHRVLLLPGASPNTESQATEELSSHLMRLHDLVRQARETNHEGERRGLLARVDDATQELMFRLRRGESPGSEPPPKDGVDATPILRSVVMEAGQRAKARGIGVRAIIEDDLVVYARTRDVRAIVSNLIENALDASARGGPIRVTAVREGDQLDLRIQDDGDGLDDLAQQKAFEAYFTTKSDGGGLGLPLVKHLVTRLRGTLIVESEIGVGTTMRVLLPRYDVQ